MAHFRGTVTGNREEASRLGTKKSGLVVNANAWNHGVRVEMFHNETTGVDEVRIYRTGGSHAGTASELVKSWSV